MVTPLRLPPRIKVLEAAGAVADGRVRLLDGGWARVVSSEGDRVYTVYVDLGQRLAYSDDNGTRLRGYIGYPIIATLMARRVLPYDPRIGAALAGVPWRRLNEQYRRYALVEEVVRRRAAEKGLDPRTLDNYVKTVMARLAALRLRRLEEPPQQPAS